MSLKKQAYLQKILLTNLYIKSWKMLFYDSGGRAIVSETEIQSGMHKECFIYICVHTRLLI